MASTDIIKGTVHQNMGASLMARVEGNDGSDITQAAITSIARKVFNHDDTDGDALGSSVPVVATVVFDTLQTGGGWSKDSDGYNFREDVAADVFIVAERHYLVQYIFTPASGAVFKQEFLCMCLETRS